MMIMMMTIKQKTEAEAEERIRIKSVVRVFIVVIGVDLILITGAVKSALISKLLSTTYTSKPVSATIDQVASHQGEPSTREEHG
jgi:hypothetical protein